MSRNRKQAANVSVSLFPFLAVLICTMGVLIVMLVLAVKSSAVKARQAKQDHEVEVQQQRDELLDKLDLEEYRVEKLAALRPEVKQRLEAAKLRRSHLDDEIRELVLQADTLREQLAQLEVDHSIATTSRQSETRKIDELKQQIEQRKTDLTQLRGQIADRPKLYSIVPTRTASGTTRRPIYVECTAQGISLKPSGIMLKLEDFTKPVLPGNPLDAALLATREYWNRFQAGSSEGEPYPLIVVRPGGATTYAIARRAMVSWDDEFGYELVDASKELDWGQADNNLTESVQQAINIAMRRQQQQVATGKVQWLGRRGQRVASAGGNAGSASGVGLGGAARPGNDSFQSSTGRNSSQAEASGGGAGGALQNALAGSAPSSDFVQPGSFQPGGQPGQYENEFQGRSTDGSSAGIDTSIDDSLSRMAGGSPGNPLRPMNAGTPSSSAGDPAAFSSSSGGQSGGSATQSLAAHRGADWALPTRTPGATPYRRPIRVECTNDQYLVYSSDGTDPVRVAISDTVDGGVDQLVNQIWKQIEGWGMAEIGGYWKPVLRLSPDRDGTRRAEELARKLEGSGIEIERQWR